MITYKKRYATRVIADEITQKITTTIRELGGDILHHTAVIVGSTAIYLTLPHAARCPHDLDLSIPQDIYRQFRSLPEWQHTETTYRTKNILRNSKCDIGIGWGGLDHAALQKRSWQTTDGLHVANITSLYTWKCTRHANKDSRDATIIYDYLHSNTLLPSHAMRYETAQLVLSLPKQLRSNKALLRLTTHGSIATFTRQYSCTIHPPTSIQELTTLSQPIDSFTLLTRKIGRILQNKLTPLPKEEQELALLALVYNNPELALHHSVEAGYTIPDTKRLAHIISELHSENGVDIISKLILGCKN